jgi:hypothetical protein
VNDVDQDLQARLDAACDEQGVDRSLIRACLAQFPAQRLADLEAQLRFFESVQRVSEPVLGALQTYSRGPQGHASTGEPPRRTTSRPNRLRTAQPQRLAFGTKGDVER